MRNSQTARAAGRFSFRSFFRSHPRNLLQALLLALLLLAGHPAAAEKEEEKDGGASSSVASKAPNTWHASSYVRGRMGFRMIHYWSKGPWMRAETLIGGHPFVTIVRGRNYYAFDRLTGKGVRVRRPAEAVAEDEKHLRLFGNEFEEIVAAGAEKVEEVFFSGNPAEIWRVTDATGRRKLWVTRDESKLPMRLEIFDRSSADTIETDYANWARGMDMPDRFFEPPAGTEIEKFEYAEYLEASVERPLAAILYPELLHGPGTR